jgi:uncharacterized membrane protein SpoIIM required for sporulation
MTPLQFEQTYEEDWAELESSLDRVFGRHGFGAGTGEPLAGARVVALYRRTCAHLALARARSYPSSLVDRLERLTSEAHQAIYQHRQIGFADVRQLLAVTFPRAVREHRGYVAAAAATFLVPALALGFLVYARPELILSVVSADIAASFDDMYSPSAEAIGRTASTDWMMFGVYIRNNIGVAFQCFAGGLFAGLGSLFFLGYNGAFGGAIAGYLTERGLSHTFYPFIATHSSFELTAIVLSGAAGLRLGHALLAPGRLTRRQALVDATRDSAVLLYGVTAMLLVAAAIEAFWSSAVWLPASVKYGVAAACWTAVLVYLLFQGRRAG